MRYGCIFENFEIVERKCESQKISQILTNLYQLLIRNLCIFEEEEEEDDDYKEYETSSKNINTKSKVSFEPGQRMII